MVSDLLGQRAEPFPGRSDSWARGARGTLLSKPSHQLGSDWWGGGQVGCGLGASPTMTTALLPYLEMGPGRAGHRLPAEREERARQSLTKGFCF